VPLLCLGSLPVETAETQQEAAMKAAIVYKLARYVEWPEDSFADDDSPLQVCLFGHADIEESLRRADGLLLRGHPLALRPIDAASPERAANCHLLYVARDSENYLRQLLAVLERRPVLSVSDIDAFAERGGIVGITRRGTRFGFRINLESARDAGLMISAPLLELADVIGGWAGAR